MKKAPKTPAAVLSWARAIVRAVSLALVVLVLAPAPAEARKVTLSYVGYLAGQPVLDLVATIEAPSGAVPGDGEYVISAEIVTTGNFAKLYRFRQSMKSEGALKSGLPSPRAHRVRQVIWNRAYTVSLQSAEDGKVAITADPPTLQSERAEREGYADKTLDPASAAVALTTLFAGRKNCAAKIAVFDGTRRFDLELVQGGVAEMEASVRSYYVGEAAKCQVTPNLKAGFRMNALAAESIRAPRPLAGPCRSGFPQRAGQDRHPQFLRRDDAGPGRRQYPLETITIVQDRRQFLERAGRHAPETGAIP
jgi:hypothetical protein